MFKKKEYSPVKISKSQVNDLALLIARMQHNADQVEKNVLKAEELLAADQQRERQALEHQQESADELTGGEALLKQLFLDVDQAKRLQHPQAAEIDNDVSNLHERWAKACEIYRELYEPMKGLDLSPRINWSHVILDKQKQMNSAGYGPSLSDVEKQIAAQNILHQEIEAYSSQLDPANMETSSDIRKQYTDLLESSHTRSRHLGTLYDYMQSCTKELAYLAEEQDRILRRDWSDQMLDPPGVRMQYEKFKNNTLLSHETETSQLLENGDQLLQMKHPASTTIEAHRDAVQNDWQSFLNLCICQETHLANIEDYKKYQLDSETVGDSLRRLSLSLEPRALANRSNPEVLLLLEGDLAKMERNEQRLLALRQLSSNIAPLRLRRLPPTKPTTLLALCDWTNEGNSISRGERLTLKDNSEVMWKVQTDAGTRKTVPGACLLIPPPDTQAMDTLASLEKELTDLKKKRTALMSSLSSSGVEAVRAAPVSSAPEAPQVSELAQQLEQISGRLEQCEKEILGRIRAPLDRRSPTTDLSSRLALQQAAVVTVRGLEAEKAAVQREMEPILSQNALGHANSSLPLKLKAVNRKFDSINTLSDLYCKKATASMFLEKQALKVDEMISGFEEQLAEEEAIPDIPNELQNRNLKLQALRRDLLSGQQDMHNLSRDLENVEQLSSSLQKSFGEFCPDIQHQAARMRQLRNRYANVNSQIQERTYLIQEAANKNQGFQTSVKSLNSFLTNLPDNTISPSDGMFQISAKQNSQKRVVEDVQRKSEDVKWAVAQSRDLQNLLNEYEAKTDKYRAVRGNKDETDAKIRHVSTMADAVEKKESELLQMYSEVSAAHNQRLSQIALAKNIIAQNEEKVTQVEVKQQMHTQSQQRNMEETDGLRKELADEVIRRTHAENDLDTYRKRFVSLKSRRGVERVEEKEVVQYYRDPKLEGDLETLRNKIKQEAVMRSGTKSQIEMINQKVILLEAERMSVKPKLVTKVLTEFERDPQLDKEAARLREEMRKIREEVMLQDSETVQMKTEITVLAQQKPKIKETVVKKEVVRLEKDPEMLKAVNTFQMEISEEGARSKALNNNIFHIRSEINTLERVIPTIQPKVILKELKRVERDPVLLEESKTLSTSLEEVNYENSSLLREISSLQLRYSEVEKVKPRLEVKEIINEIYRVDPDTELERERLRKKLQEYRRNCSNLEQEINMVMVDLKTLRSQKPKVEYKEVTQEVIKEEKSPEVIRELQRLNEQVSRLRVTYDSTLDILSRLRKERDELKTEKSKVEMKLVTKEVIKYENDPMLEKEADRLKKDLRLEIQQRRSVEEMVFDLQNKYILLERQKPEEKIVTQEVVHLQTDPKQIQEHEKLNKTLDEVVKVRRKLELEVRQLRSLVEEKERNLVLMDDRQKKIQVEGELRRIRTLILDLENTPPPIEEKIIIEEVLKVERDPKLERLTDGLRADMETEGTSISRLERDIRNLRIKLDILQKEKSVEKIVYKEVIRVEKDQAVESERDHLLDLVGQERNARRDQEDQIQKLNFKMTHLQSSRSSISQEESSLKQGKDSLLKEKDKLRQELQSMEAEKQGISITFQQQSKLLSERNQASRQRSIKMESEVQSLETDILNEKDRIHQRESTIMELQAAMKKDDHSETHTRETNLSTKITILDPETGKDMSPYDAYLEGLIDRKQYIHLQELECDWEEISSQGPDGESSILQDRKSGKQFSVKNALADGRLTQYDVHRYKEGKMPISEFALLVAGENQPKPSLSSISVPKTSTKTSTSSSLSSMPSSLRSSYTSLTSSSSAEELFPISGILDTTTSSRMSVRSALTRKLLDPDTALVLLEAQAATGGIVDLNRKDKYSVHKAAERGLIDTSHLHKLLNAQKAFTGVEDPVTRERLSAGQAGEKGWIPHDSAMRFMEAQYLTGGLVDPHKAGRLSVKDALYTKIIDSTIAKDLQDVSAHSKTIVDPISKEKISYKEAMDRCKKDVSTGLLLLPAASGGSHSQV